MPRRTSTERQGWQLALLAPEYCTLGKKISSPIGKLVPYDVNYCSQVCFSNLSKMKRETKISDGEVLNLTAQNIANVLRQVALRQDGRDRTFAQVAT